MLWKLLLSLAAVFSHHGRKDSEEIVPSNTGPQSLVDADIGEKALYGKHFGGDMILPRNWNKTDAGIRDPLLRWSGYPGEGRVAYVIDSSVSNMEKMIRKAMADFEKNTCIKFVERTSERDFVNIFYGNDCSSEVGKIGGLQQLSLGNGCGNIGMIVHQLGHAIGLLHEHQRSDRDKYITVNRDFIKLGFEDKFEKFPKEKEIISTEYNVDSIMHFGNYAFSVDPGNKATIVQKNGRPLKDVSEKRGLTPTDIDAINKLYECDTS